MFTLLRSHILVIRCMTGPIWDMKDNQNVSIHGPRIMQLEKKPNKLMLLSIDV